MCTWTVSSVIDHYLNNGRSVYGCTMDLSKAFDMVEWKELFNTLIVRGVQRVFLRVLLYIYRNQQCDVRWGERFSSRFFVKNGVMQGAVSSPLPPVATMPVLQSEDALCLVLCGDDVYLPCLDGSQNLIKLHRI